jgi:tetratricopeptide (TPR) repeat protein
LAQLKSSPNDPKLLANVGNVYYDTRQFKEAIEYYSRSLQSAPNNADVRTDMGTALYQSGQPDQALTEYDKVLKQNPKHANALVNRGIVQWEAKMDLQAALNSWEELLKTNPDYPGRADVEQLMARVKAHMNIKPGTPTSKPAKM